MSNYIPLLTVMVACPFIYASATQLGWSSFYRDAADADANLRVCVFKIKNRTVIFTVTIIHIV